MVVITTPVTTGGKNRMMVANSGAIASPAKETPCASGRWEPKNGGGLRSMAQTTVRTSAPRSLS